MIGYLWSVVLLLCIGNHLTYGRPLANWEGEPYRFENCKIGEQAPNLRPP